MKKFYFLLMILFLSGFCYGQGLAPCQDKQTKLYGYCSGAKVVIEAKYTEALCFPNEPKGIAPVRVGKKWGYINTDGNYVLEPQFDDAYTIMNGFARIKQDGRWGYINAEGVVVVTPEFEQAANFGSDRKAIVKKPGEENSGYLLYNKASGEISYRTPSPR